MNPLLVPISVLTDSYKASHYRMYPPSKQIYAYGEFRAPFAGQKEDHRVLFYGIRYLVETYLERQWTMEDVELADKFFSTHNAAFTPFPFPKELFIKFIKENNGYFPLKVEALPEGTACYVHVPVYQISAVEPYAGLATFFETLLTQIWYPTVVATLSRRTKDVIDEAFELSVDEEMHFFKESRLHDFGFRGVTGVEQSILGGVAHLLNFGGSDTLSACYYAQMVLNKGKPIGSSIPATEHSVMTSWKTEKQAIEHMIDNFGTGVFACVLDSYDYEKCLNEILPQIAERKVTAGGSMTLRPDSGEPVEAVMQGLLAAEKVFGVETNKKGFKCLNKAAVIQGDGINFDSVKQILKAVHDAKFSAQNVLFGMGGGLLQKVNRDTMQFATKLSYIQYEDGSERDVMKRPKTDSLKISLPGKLAVKRVNGIPTVFPMELVSPEENMLKVVYDCGPVKGVWDYDFDSVRERAASEWTKLPKQANVISKELKEKIDNWVPASQE